GDRGNAGAARRRGEQRVGSGRSAGRALVQVGQWRLRRMRGRGFHRRLASHAGLHTHSAAHHASTPARYAAAQMSERDPQPRITTGEPGGALRLSGSWTLAHADAIAAALEAAPTDARGLDASDVTRLDSLGVLQLLRFARRRGLDFAGFRFSDEHQPLVSAIDDGADDRPHRKREYGVAEALARLGRAVHNIWKEVLALLAFLGEVLVKMLRLVREPGRFRATPTVHHMEQVGLDAVPLVFLLCYLVGAVIAFLGANVLREFGATQFVVELVSIAFLREFAVLLAAIILAGRTASAFTAHIGSMVSREEVDAIR